MKAIPPSAVTSEPRGMSEDSIDRRYAHESVHEAGETTSSAAAGLGTHNEARTATNAEWMAVATGYVREHPLSALGVAFAAGFMMSRLTGH